jgi:N-acetylglucosamine-6-phosphate deacetylase
MADLVVRGASVLTPTGWLDEDLCVTDGRVAATPAADATVVEAEGLLAVPGFVDVQCNGALGIDLARQPERLWELAAMLPRWGVTAWLPTIVTSVPEVVDLALATLAAGPPGGLSGATPLGLHLEGPFLAASKRGAHEETLLRAPSLEVAAGWSAAGGVALVTLAPELPGAVDVIRALVARGVVVSLGHSAATADDARAAFDAGATAVTHLFNAMAPLHHRSPGLAGAALVDDRIHVGLIADGIHVAPELLTVAQRTLGERLVVVTDAVGALGLPDGTHSLGRLEITVAHGAVRLRDGTLAGAACSMDHAVRNLAAMTGCPIESALQAASAAPARLVGELQRGALEAGRRGDLVVLTRDLQVAVTIVGGSVVHRSASA